ncbi:DNA-binding response regulator [Leptospira gomenensis]|uniref:DNA-binding response regulator n=1 Tax=Leptospira gomenensis TaxID=2484974 RepID=A0A5F1Y8S1_9LEPT|nr:LytTR family DNA-binding domain-containing protein [Leptospira gomenensis]TGK31772.1 DNA-binding response regulator [Leptospira gomenensis]TGK41600.1 DNA-binding response regulator [Leptospira gomenensis]TGK44419.1 DNA-binding response regulator [Leptospira gomenensis]TGK61440.1 DNA-binding response regulator [Leptospira gomenensis]
MDKLYKTVIIEDDSSISDFIKKEVENHGKFDVVGTFDRGSDALRFLIENKVDLLLLDIELPDFNGFDILKELDEPPLTISVTGYEGNAKTAYDYGNIDYVTKPIVPERLYKALDRAYEKVSSMKGVSIHNYGTKFKGVDRNVFVTYSNIVYISSNGKHSILHTVDDGIEVIGTLKDLEPKLSMGKFRRVHKQYIINMEYLAHIEYFSGGSHVAYMKDEEKSQVPVSRIYLSGI